MAAFIALGSDVGSQPTAADSGGGGGWLSGLSGLFSSVGTAITQTYQAVNRPTTPVPVTAGGTYYNPQTGSFQTISGIGTQLGGSSGILLLLGFGLIAILLLRR